MVEFISWKEHLVYSKAEYPPAMFDVGLNSWPDSRFEGSTRQNPASSKRSFTLPWSMADGFLRLCIPHWLKFSLANSSQNQFQFSELKKLISGFRVQPEWSASCSFSDSEFLFWWRGCVKKKNFHWNIFDYLVSFGCRKGHGGLEFFGQHELYQYDVCFVDQLPVRVTMKLHHVMSC